MIGKTGRPKSSQLNTDWNSLALPGQTKTRNFMSGEPSTWMRMRRGRPRFRRS